MSGPSVNGGKRQAWRILIVALSLLSLATVSGPDLRRIAGHPLGVLGIYFDYHGVVEGVAPEQAASGVRVGDRIDLVRAGPDRREGYIGLGTADAGERVDLPMMRGETRYVATLVTFPESSDRIAMVWLRAIIQLMVTLLAVVIVSRRPSAATWGLFFLVFIGCSPINDVYLMGPQWWRTIGINLYLIVGNGAVGNYGAIVFAIYLLHPGRLPRWRRIAQACAIAVACVSFAVAAWRANALLFAPWADAAGAIAYAVFQSLPYAVAPLLLIATYFESAPALRERLRWIIAGFIASTVCNVIDFLGSQGNLGIIQMSYVTHSLLVSGVYVFITVPVAYAILKHHVIDINVAISRATVYTTLSIIVVGTFALVDFFFSHALAEKNAGLIADVGLALILGFSFNAIHRHVDAFVERLLFRRRHLAEEHVRGIADAMTYAHGETHVRSMALDEPVRAFDLTGSRFIGNVAAAPGELETLASYVEACRRAVRLGDGQWNAQAIFREGWAPALAVPVYSHGRLDALLLYGLHRNGTDLDSEEVALLEHLGASAGAALDRLEADALRREIAELRKIPAI